LPQSSVLFGHHSHQNQLEDAGVPHSWLLLPEVGISKSESTKWGIEF
jgi:hypothetical protein